eukprot:9185540-Pyramimonas_sp.AAC.1
MHPLRSLRLRSRQKRGGGGLIQDRGRRRAQLGPDGITRGTCIQSDNAVALVPDIVPWDI